jgi:hypothetical protein
MSSTQQTEFTRRVMAKAATLDMPKDLPLAQISDSLWRICGETQRFTLFIMLCIKYNDANKAAAHPEYYHKSNPKKFIKLCEYLSLPHSWTARHTEVLAQYAVDFSIHTPGRAIFRQWKIFRFPNLYTEIARSNQDIIFTTPQRSEDGKMTVVSKAPPYSGPPADTIKKSTYKQPWARSRPIRPQEATISNASFLPATNGMAMNRTHSQVPGEMYRRFAARYKPTTVHSERFHAAPPPPTLLNGTHRAATSIYGKATRTQRPDQAAPSAPADVTPATTQPAKVTDKNVRERSSRMHKVRSN